MRGDKLIELLRTFDKQAWKETTAYLKGILGKTAGEMVLFEYIKRYKRNLFSPKLNVETIRKEAFTDLSSKRLYNIIYSLTSRIEEYWVMKDLSTSENSFEYDVLLAGMYKNRGLYGLFVEEMGSLKRKTDRTRKIDIWKEAYMIRLYYDYYLSDMDEDDLVKKEVFKNILNAFGQFTDQLALFFLAEEVNIRNFWGEKWHIKMPAFLKKEQIRDNHSTTLLHHLYEAVKSKDEANYLRLKSEFLRQKDLLSGDLYFFILLQLINQIVHLTRMGWTQYSRDMLVFYDLGLRSGVLLKNKKLSENRYFNIIDFALKQREWEWIRQFRKEWSETIETNHHNAVMALTDAYVSFSGKRYKEVLEILNNIKSYKNIGLSLRAKWLTLCSLYEIYEDEEVTYDYIASFRFYLYSNKKKMGKATLEGSENFIRVIERMVKHERKEKIKAFVSSCQFLNFRLWIEEKLDA